MYFFLLLSVDEDAGLHLHFLYLTLTFVVHTVYCRHYIYILTGSVFIREQKFRVPSNGYEMGCIT